MDDLYNKIHRGDCIKMMNSLPAGSADLVFADPPFNIGYDYDEYNDTQEHQQYIAWSAQWISAVYRVLKSDGTFWLAIGDDYAAELKLESQKLGFHCRSWVVWYYTFGVNCTKKFTRSHTHLFHFIKDPEKFTFLEEDLENRVPSARELVYNDKRANPKGRLPDDTWKIRPADAIGELVSDDDETWHPQLHCAPSDTNRTYALRPQDLVHSFNSTENTWYFPRVAGTFKERAGFHGCQMPEQLLGRIIRTCSNPGELILDPFSGSATTLAVAKKLGRRFVGFDISKAYVQYGLQRLEGIRVGDRLDGSPEPMKSAPRTNRVRTKKGRSQEHSYDSASPQELKYDQDMLKRTSEALLCAYESTYSGSVVPKAIVNAEFIGICERLGLVGDQKSWKALLKDLQKDGQIAKIHNTALLGVTEAFKKVHNGFSTDRVVADPELNEEFVDVCVKLGLPGNARVWNTLLFRLRKTGMLSDVPTIRQTTLSWEDCDSYIFAGEIAWQLMIDEEHANSLDEILCDPTLAKKFDRIAKKFAPGFEPLDYRWAALKIRKEAKYARSRATVLTPPSRLGEKIPLDSMKASHFHHTSGLYVISERSRKLYVGETLDLKERLKQRYRKTWVSEYGPVYVQILPVDPVKVGRLAWQSCMVKKYKHRPLLNCVELRSAS